MPACITAAAHNRGGKKIIAGFKDTTGKPVIRLMTKPDKTSTMKKGN
jgi:hypothetical protein